MFNFCRNRHYLTLDKEKDINPDLFRQPGLFYYKKHNDILQSYGTRIITILPYEYFKYINDEIDDISTTDFNGISKNIHCYTFAHRLICSLLFEASRKGVYKGIKVHKKRLVRYLGYTTKDRHIYKRIKDTLDWLRMISYLSLDYNYLSNKRKPIDGRIGKIKPFITRMESHHKSYELWINPIFVGPVDDERKRGGFVQYPVSVLTLTKNYSPSAYFLTDFLIREMGNNRLNTKEHKIISYKVKRFINEASINYRKKYKSVERLMKSLKEIEIIDKIEPKIDEMQEMKPERLINEIMRVYIKNPPEELNQHIINKIKSVN